MMTTKKRKTEPAQAFSADTKRVSTQPAERPARQHDDQAAVQPTAEIVENDRRRVPDRTAGQNDSVDQKRNDEQQYHAAGVAHDPHNRTQQRIDSGDPDAGDVDDETRAQSAPYNKTYGHHP